jgi:hypothetical protein
MNCVAKAVNKLFPNQDLTEFYDRKLGVGMGDIQRMIPTDLSVWAVYCNHYKCVNFDLIRQLPKTSDYIPLFLFSSIMSDRYKLHCEFALWDRNTVIVDEKEFDADEYFMRNKILQIAALIKFETHKILIVKK